MNKCLYCGKSVKNKFCNVSCQNRYQKRKPTHEQCVKASNTRFGKYKEYKVKCFNCNKEFIVKEREKLFPQKEKYYCSRSCANTRQHSLETRKKISYSITKLINEGHAPGFIKVGKEVHDYKLLYPKEKYIKICEFCNKEFETINIKKRFCNNLCARRYCIKLASKAQHEKMKNNLEWWSKIQKNLYAYGKQYVAGGTTKWYDYKDIRVQGTYELRTCFILDKWKEEGKIKNWEYTKDRIKYIGQDNKEHSYLLDFKVFENDESFYYLETKGYIHDNDELKWKATRDKGYKLIVWFDEDIKKNEK